MQRLSNDERLGMRQPVTPKVIVMLTMYVQRGCTMKPWSRWAITDWSIPRSVDGITCQTMANAQAHTYTTATILFPNIALCHREPGHLGTPRAGSTVPSTIAASYSTAATPVDIKQNTTSTQHHIEISLAPRSPSKPMEIPQLCTHSPDDETRYYQATCTSCKTRQ